MLFKQRVENEQIMEAHLRNLGVESTEDINDWFRKSYSDGYWLKPIDAIVETLHSFRDKTVYIVGDYDVDGICATAIMLRGLRWAGFTDVRFKIPKRSEGFGISTAIIDAIFLEIMNENKTATDVLLFTVDNGIAGIDAIAHAKTLGFSVIVTDHHEPTVENGKPVLPDADLILNANAIADSAAFEGYCGAANAYKIMKELLGEDTRKDLLVPLAMFATICDQMVLKEENYVIAYLGLKQINGNIRGTLPGIQALAKVFDLVHWTSTTVGFTVGPSINALERMEDGAAGFGVELLVSDDKTRCVELAGILKGYNDQRKAVTAEAVKATDVRIAQLDEPLPSPLILYIPEVKLGIVGILAGRVMEKYGLPTGIFTEADDGTLSGSFRSPEGYDIKEHLDQCPELFLSYGGHAPAAGASVTKEGFETMVTRMQETALTPLEAKDQGVFYYDVEISNREIVDAIEKNEAFQPLGNGNEDLMFKVTDFEVIPDRGGYKTQMRGGGVRMRSLNSTAVGFGLWDLATPITGPCRVTLYGQIANNYWKKSNGEVVITPQIQFLALEMQDADEYLTPFAQALKAKAMQRQ